MALRSGLSIRKRHSNLSSFQVSWLSSFTELGIVSSSSRGRVDFRSIPIGMYVLTLYLVQLTYPVVLPIRQCTFPYGYHTVSHHIGHIIRGLTETRRELRELSSQDRIRTCVVPLFT